MGAHKDISHDKFPEQSEWYGKPVKVCFNYDTTKQLYGVIVRDDLESPGETILEVIYQLPYSKKYVRGSECQFSMCEWEAKANEKSSNNPSEDG